MTRCFTARMALAGTGLLALVAATGCQVDVGGQTLPSPYYMTDDVQYFPAGPEFKLSREAAAIQEAKARELRRKAGLPPATIVAPAPGGAGVLVPPAPAPAGPGIAPAPGAAAGAPPGEIPVPGGIAPAPGGRIPAVPNQPVPEDVFDPFEAEE